MERRIEKFLKERKSEGLLRTLRKTERLPGGKISVDGCEYVDFSSNDYLGLSNHPALRGAAMDALSSSVGSSASRLMTGSTGMHHALEDMVSKFKGKEAALVFNSGYQANVGILSALCGKKDVIFSDKLNHASIIDGIKLSGSSFSRFRHNDMGHLEELLGRERNNFDKALIITETVFSMDGDISPLEKIVELKKKHDCVLMVDEAHATGIFGKDGSGVVKSKGLTADVDIIMGTFSKALGSFGSYVAASNGIRDYLINTCRSFIYSTALPKAVIAANMAALDVVEKEPERRNELLSNADSLRNLLLSNGLSVKGESQILPVIVGENEETLRVSDELKKKGYWVMPVRYPTVPKNEARIRISLSYDHDRDVLGRFAKEVKEVFRECSTSSSCHLERV